MSANDTPRFYCNTLSTQKNSFINLVQVGWDKCAPSYTYSHYRDMYIIHYVKSGAGTVETNGHRYNLSQHDAFIVRPNILTVHTADADDPWELYFFSFSGSFAEEILQKTVFKDNTVSVSTNDATFWKTITDSALELNIAPQRELQSYEYLFKLLSFFDISNSPFDTNFDDTGAYQKYISEVQKYIQSNYAKAIKISELADLLNVSRSHLYRIFKESTGTSIENYLVTVRMNAARSLLEDTEFSAASISSLVGYAHYTTFFKMFKLYTGLTPQQYRAKVRAGQEDTENTDN